MVVKSFLLKGTIWLCMKHGILTAEARKNPKETAVAQQSQRSEIQGYQNKAAENLPLINTDTRN